MASLQEDYSDPGSFTDEDSQLFPRCSTPIIDPRAVCRPQENRGIRIVEKSKKYCDWKNRLHRKKHSRKFKLRSSENIPQFWNPANSTIVSGYVKQELPEEINQESIVRPEPVYQQVWVPISAPFLAPAMTNCHHHYHHHPSPAMWFKIPYHQTPQQYQFTPVFGASGETAFFDMINNGYCHNHLPCGLHHHHHHHHHDHNYCGVSSQIIPCEHHYPQAHMNHGLYHYPYHHYPTQTQYYTYPSETQITSSNGNGVYRGDNVCSDMFNP